jgi:hypothetical protein
MRAFSGRSVFPDGLHARIAALRIQPFMIYEIAARFLRRCWFALAIRELLLMNRDGVGAAITLGSHRPIA